MGCHYKHVPVEAFPDELWPAIAADRQLEAAIHWAIDGGRQPNQDEAVRDLAGAALAAWAEFGMDCTTDELIAKTCQLADIPQALARAGLLDLR